MTFEPYDSPRQRADLLDRAGISSPADTRALNGLIEQKGRTGGGVIQLVNNGSPYILDQAVILESNVVLIGIGKPTLFLGNGINTSVIESLGFQTLVGTNGTGIENFRIQGFIIDGNRENNALPAANAGHGIATYGRDFLIEDCLIQNCYRTGLWTEYSATGVSPFNGRVSDVTCDTLGEHGWYNDVSDCHGKSINIRSASQNTDDTFDALHFESAVRGSIFNTWRGGGAANSHRYSVYADDGNILSDLSLETATTAQIFFNGDNNQLSNVRSFNLLGGDHIIDTGTFNQCDILITTGGLGVSTDFGLRLTGPNVWAAKYDITMSGTHAGIVNFVSSAGANRITGRARELNNPPVTGVPADNDSIDIHLDGSADGENLSYFKIPGRAGTLAASGADQAGAAALESTVTRVFAASANQGVRLPSETSGAIWIVTNSSPNTARVYPATGQTIIGGAANAHVDLADGVGIMFVGMGNGEWMTFTHT